MQSYKVLALIGCVIGLAISMADLLVIFGSNDYRFFGIFYTMIVYIFALVITFTIGRQKIVGISLIISAVLVFIFGFENDGIIAFALLLVAGTIKLVKEEKNEFYY